MTSVNNTDTRLPRALRNDGPWAYLNHAAFTVAWWWRRTLTFAVVAGVFGAVVGTALWETEQRADIAIAVCAHFLVGATVIGSAGPALATWVRRQPRLRARESTFVVVALLLGLVVSAAVDGWVSTILDELMASTREKASSSSSSPSPSSSSSVGNIVALVVYAALGGGLSLPRYFREQREQAEVEHEHALATLTAEKHALDARLAVLQAQVEPHILFNSLASVQALIASNPTAAQELVAALAAYLRSTIPRLRERTVMGEVDATLGDQLELCAHYLQVMQLRMGGRLRVVFEVEPATREVLFPSLLLMTLVDNAIKHGLEPKVGNACITLSASLSNTTPPQLVVQVLDDGVGLREGGGPGVGLTNLRAWLKTRYGTAASFTLSTRNSTTAATMTLPAQWRTPSPAS